MKPRHTECNRVGRRICQTLGLPPLHANDTDGMAAERPCYGRDTTPIVHVKLIRCENADGGEYLMVVAYDLDPNGHWLPHHTATATNYSELKEALCQLAATADGMVIQGSHHFSRLARELGLPLLAAEWGRV